MSLTCLTKIVLITRWQQTVYYLRQLNVQKIRKKYEGRQKSFTIEDINKSN